MESSPISIRQAQSQDLTSIINLLWDDEYGRERESLSSDAFDSYRTAFNEVIEDPNSVLLVSVRGQKVCGCLQLTIIPGLSFQGLRRCLIEDVRVDSALREKGIGRLLMAEAEDFARDRGCRLIELFVHSDRDGAHSFYKACGFNNNHCGFRKIVEI